ncbi:hypothetical protein D3C72_2121050 [compost metagenome]
MAVAHPHRMRGEIDAAPARCRFAEKERGSGRGVDLVLVVHFQHLDVPARRIERTGGLLHEHRKQVDAEAHIAGFDDPRMAGSRLDLCVVHRQAAGGAEHVDDARLRREPGIFR